VVVAQVQVIEVRAQPPQFQTTYYCILRSLCIV